MRMLVEYKPFEPGLYHTDIADWGMSYTLCKKCGDRALVLVDLGHHLPGTNIEHIVAYLLDEGMLGGFHFNNRKYADDDLMVGSINPYEFFLIYHELVKAENERGDPRIDYMVDQGFNTKKKIPGMIQTVGMIQATYARALWCPPRSRRAGCPVPAWRPSHWTAPFARTRVGAGTPPPRNAGTGNGNLAQRPQPGEAGTPRPTDPPPGARRVGGPAWHSQ